MNKKRALSLAKELERLLGEVRKRERRTENRIYTPKTSIMEGTL